MIKASIYARSCREEKSPALPSIENQVSFCQSLAIRHSVAVQPAHIFADHWASGTSLPSCWTAGSGPARPALSALIEAIESDGIGRVIIQRPQVLGTSSEVLTNLLSFFAATDVWIIAEPDPASFADEPAAAFPSSLLRQRVLYDTDEERERKSAARRKKAEEITRLKLKIARLEAEISQL